MSEYIVLARKYRSRTFDEIVGQEHVAETLSHAIESNRVAHAYLFCGTRGVGKTTAARILAKCLNCLAADAPTVEPCNECGACADIARGEDIDVVEIDGASNRGIDEIRQLRSNVMFQPARERYKIYYIDEVHMLTTPAFNALLKTLEEPPAHVKFIFATTEPERIPATILSRCQRFDFRNIPTSAIAAHLEAICAAEEVAAENDGLFRIARAAAGSMRDALGLLDQIFAGGGAVTEDEVVRLLGTPADEKILALVRAVADGSAADAVIGLDAVLASGVSLANTAGSLAAAFRNMMLVLTCGADSDLIELPESAKKETAALAESFSLPALVHALGIMQRTLQELKRSSVARPLLEAVLVRLAKADQFIDPASLIERLERGGSADGAPKKKR